MLNHTKIVWQMFEPPDEEFSIYYGISPLFLPCALQLKPKSQARYSSIDYSGEITLCSHKEYQLPHIIYTVCTSRTMLKQIIISALGRSSIIFCKLSGGGRGEICGAEDDDGYWKICGWGLRGVRADKWIHRLEMPPFALCMFLGYLSSHTFKNKSFERWLQPSIKFNGITH